MNSLEATGNRYEIGPSLAYNLDLFGGIRRSIEVPQEAQTAAVVLDQPVYTYVTLVDQIVVTAFDYAAVRAQIRGHAARSWASCRRNTISHRTARESAGKGDPQRHPAGEEARARERARDAPRLSEQQRDAYRDALARLSGQAPDEFRMPALTLADFKLPGQLPVSLPSALVRRRPTSWRRGESACGQCRDRDSRGGAAATAESFRAIRPADHRLTNSSPAGRRLVRRHWTDRALFDGGTLAARPTKPKSATRKRSRPIGAR